MSDDSQLDKKYFIDSYKYNCPFCNRRHVSYRGRESHSFDWNDNKKCHVYFIECDSCERRSMHLSFIEIPLIRIGAYPVYRFDTEAIEHLDDTFFYSAPTSFFVIDKNIPVVLRELFTEAEGCLKSNFLTGASACIRKIVYELALKEGATGINYDERIRSLKKTRPKVDPVYFDTLLTIQQLTSDKVHEGAYDKWEAKHLRLILVSISEILHEIYVIPKSRKNRRETMLKLKEKVMGKKGENTSTSDFENAKEKK